MVNTDKIILYSLLGVVSIILIFAIFGMSKSEYNEDDYNKFVSAEQENKCITPEGYTDEEWKEHMSHHPDRYKECLT